MRSIRKSSNIHLSWTKIKHQNSLNPIALFSTICIVVYAYHLAFGVLGNYAGLIFSHVFKSHHLKKL